MGKSLRVLIVEDSPMDEQLIVRELHREGYDLSWLRVDTPFGMRQALLQPAWDLIISDYTMPGFSGFEALEILKSSSLDLPFICVSGSIGEDTAVGMMRACRSAVACRRTRQPRSRPTRSWRGAHGSPTTCSSGNGTCRPTTGRGPRPSASLCRCRS